MPVIPGYLQLEKLDFIRQLLTTNDVPEPPAICRSCDDLGARRLAAVVLLGEPYCLWHAELYDVAKRAAAFMRARELGVGAS